MFELTIIFLFGAFGIMVYANNKNFKKEIEELERDKECIRDQRDAYKEKYSKADERVSSLQRALINTQKELSVLALILQQKGYDVREEERKYHEAEELKRKRQNNERAINTIYSNKYRSHSHAYNTYKAYGGSDDFDTFLALGLMYIVDDSSTTYDSSDYSSYDSSYDSSSSSDSCSSGGSCD